MSYDPFGWATSHYGRWVFQNRWVWVPSTDWAPAWVSWRQADGVVGWAPAGFDPDAYVPDRAWRFVAAPALFAPDLRRHYITGDVPRYVERSVPVARYVRHGREVWPAGPSQDWLRTNRVAVVRTQPDLTAIGRFDPARRAELERSAQARQREWEQRRARVAQVQRELQRRVAARQQEELRLVEAQRRL